MIDACYLGVMVRIPSFMALVAPMAVAAVAPAAAQTGRSGGWHEPTLSVTLGACRTLVAHHPSPDVTYQPGVDVEGRAVAPADLPGSGGAAGLGDVFVIRLSAELARRLGLPRQPVPLEAEAELGIVTVQGDRVLLNGQPLAADGEATLARICHGRLR